MLPSALPFNPAGQRGANPNTKNMNKPDAKQLGIQSGYEAAIYGEFTVEQLTDQDAFTTEVGQICENKRQYAGSPTYDFARANNGDGLFDAFDEGETIGIKRGWRKLLPERRAAEAKRELQEAIGEHERREYDDLLAVGDLSEVPNDYRGRVLHINDHGNCTLYVRTARKFKEIASCV